MVFRIGVDIGGTFTDFVLYDADTGAISVEKVPTTPSNPEIGCLNAVAAGATADILAECDQFLHGTTVGLNALIERRGGCVGLLCTEGFRDSLEIRRGSRPHRFTLDWTPPPPLVPRHRRLPARERVSAEGEILVPVSVESVEVALQGFREAGVDSVAISFINSYANPHNELEARRILRDAGYTGDISCSHEVSREYRDYERTSTAVIDAFVRTRMSDYLNRLELGLRDRQFKGACLITRSGGGCMGFDEARQRSFETINSGPVAGAQGAAEISRAFGLGDLVAADVGGTSFDTTLIQAGRPPLLYSGEIAGMPVQSPWVDVRSIGSGGGSIAHVDVGGLLHVGPESAGATPGPACYGRGGERPTTTDAALVLGMLGAGKLSSGLQLDRELAHIALQSIAQPLQCSVEEAAVGIVRIACADMANAIREITIERGVDPRGLKLLAFGGAGPMLATQIARELDILTIVVPPYAGNFSAWGLLGSDLVRSNARTRLFPLVDESIDAIEQNLEEMFAELDSRSERNEAPESGLTDVALGLRFQGQEHELNISIRYSAGKILTPVDEIRDAFRAAYLRNFDMVLDNAVEVITIRTEIRVPLAREVTGILEGPPSSEVPSNGDIYSFASATWSTARRCDRADLRVGEVYHGPAVISEATTTTYVDADFQYHIDGNGCLWLEQKGE